MILELFVLLAKGGRKVEKSYLTLYWEMYKLYDVIGWYEIFVEWIDGRFCRVRGV